MLNLPNMKTIEELVDDIYRNFKLKSPLNDIYETANLLGGTVILSKNNTIKKAGMKFIIEISEKLTYPERRLKFAELVGYLFLVMGYSIDKATWSKASYSKMQFIKKKKFIQYFARVLIVPKKELYRVWDLYRTDLTVDTVTIANYFEVSMDDITNRGIDLELYTHSAIAVDKDKEET